MAARYWLYDWLDDLGVTDARRAQKALASKRGRDALREAASKAGEPGPVGSQDGIAVTAGRGLDLSGHLDCLHPTCRRKQVDGLLRSVLHYFDTVVVADPVAHEVTHHWHEADEKLVEWLLGHIETLLYLREAKADSLFVFHNKPTPCEEHWRQHAAEVGLSDMVSTADQLASFIATDSRIGTKPRGEGLEFSLAHPFFEHTIWGVVGPDEVKAHSGDARAATAAAAVRRYMAHLTSDVAAAKRASAPLGAGLYVHRRLLTRTLSEGDEAQVAFRMDLPVLRNIGTDALLRVRAEESEAFSRFQHALRRALRERLAVSTKPAAELGAEISGDVIEPELNRIRSRLAAAESSLKTKLTMNVGLGALVTTCGLLAGVTAGTAVLAGAGALAASTASAAAKKVDEGNEVKSSEMYFVWKASQH